MMNVEAGRDVIFLPPTCQKARTVCEGKRVLACVDGQPGEELETCVEACSLGRCTTLACEQGERLGGTHGCRFFGVQPDNIDSDDEQALMVILSNSGATPAAARLEVREAGGPWSPVASTSVAAGGGARIQLHRPASRPGIIMGGAYRVETDSPVLAVQIVSDNSDRSARSSAGTVLLPLQALGREYLAVTTPAKASPEVVRAPGGRGGAGTIAVVGTVPDTIVHIGPTSVVTMALAGAAPEPLAGPFDVLLGQGDVLQVFSDAADGDLTGTSIEADAPVAVFSGNIFTTYGFSLGASNGGDLAQEQLPPTASWADEYIGARMSPQAGCEPFFGAGVGLWRVVAADDDTEVTLLPAPGTTFEMTSPFTERTFHLKRGAFQWFFARGSRNPPTITAGDFVVKAKKPILLVQWLDCEPGLALGLDARFVAGDLVFTLPPGFDHEVVVVRKGASSVSFDGQPFPSDRWKPVSEVGTYSVARLSAAELGRCADAFDPCEHILSGSGAGFGVSWRGMDIVCGYALTVPPGSACALPNVASCIP